MSVELLDHTRKINHLLNESEAEVIDFNKFCQILSHTLSCDVLLISGKGKVLGIGKTKEIPVLTLFSEVFYGDYISEKLQSRLMNILSTNENVNMDILGVGKESDYSCFVMITPVRMAGERLGSLLACREKTSFSIDDIILNEYAATVIGLAMQRAVSEEASVENRKEHEIHAAVHTLSKLEKQAVAAVLDEMSGKKEALIVTSRLSKKTGITRSIVVNALKKCASAGLIDTKSAGNKGTCVKVVNELFSCSYIRKFTK